MLSMDSANMHLASLFGVPVVSLWGGTHPWLGFYGWGQADENILQIDLPCRPSSVFGNKPCPVHGDAGCMQDITPEMVVEKVQQVLS
jgi:ADP-heptose:LPS heptosyltransferase